MTKESAHALRSSRDYRKEFKGLERVARLPHLAHTLYISSANVSHASASRHVQRKAVYISRINGKLIGTSHGSDVAVTDIVERIQREFEKVTGRREHFAPFFTRKLGQPYQVDGHGDHIP